MPASFRSSLLGVCGVAFATLVIPGCTAFERGAEQGDVAVDPKNGCPDLRGDYAFDAIDDDGQSDPRFTSDAPSGVDGTLFTPRSPTRQGPGELSRFAGVGIQPVGDHGLAFRFVVPHTAVMQELERLRQDERPRYANWYALMQPEGRARFQAAHGEAALRERLEVLGPTTSRLVVLDQFRDYTCDGGWVVLPREYGTPVRLTLDPHGNLVFESKEYSGFQVDVWCGDGCKGFKVPTGAYLSVTTWPRTTSIHPWDADVLGQGFVFARPADVIEAEQAAYPDEAAVSSPGAPRADASVPPTPVPPGFAPLATIEARVMPLLAKGCTIETSRYSGEVVILSGTASDIRAVSDSLRALDGRVREAGRAGSGVELLSIESTPEGRYRFEMRLPASSLTRT